jgi:hypothetical protein
MNLKMYLRWMLMVTIVAMPLYAFAMDFRLTNKNPVGDGHIEGANPFLLLHGEIQPGDYERLLKYAAANNINLVGKPFILASPGGDVTEALKIGRLVKRLYAEVVVGPTFGPCASACFIIFASSVNRMALAGLVGIHRPYLSRERFRSLSPSAAETLETRALTDAEIYLHELRVPNNLVDTMFEHASTEIHWLSDDELDHQLGQRPAWYEEFLIAKCGFDKKAALDELAGRASVNAIKGVEAALECGTRLTNEDAYKAYHSAIRPYEVTLPPIPDHPGPNAVAICASGPCANQNR